MDISAKDIIGWTRAHAPARLRDTPAILITGQDLGGILDLALALGSDGADRISIDGTSFRAGDILAYTTSGSLFSASTCVVLRDPADKLVGEIQKVLDEGITAGNRLVVIAPELKSTSKLRKLFAARTECAAVTLYAMRTQERESFARDLARDHGITIDRGAIGPLGRILTGDRAVSARICETVFLHAAGCGRGTVLIEDVRAIGSDSDEDDLSMPLDLALQGDLAASILALDHRLSAGENPIAMIRIFLHRAWRLRAILQESGNIDDAVGRAKPPVFWTEKERVTGILKKTPQTVFDRLIQALDRVEDGIVERSWNPTIALRTLLIAVVQGKMKARSA